MRRRLARAATLLLALLAIGGGEPIAPTWPAARLEPIAGAYLAVSLDWDADSPAAFAARLGASPAVYVRYTRFPLGAAERRYLDAFIDQVAAQRGLALIALEPHGGLETVTPAAADDLAARLAGYNARGVPAFVRFGHEMNGSWYAWGQRPAAYIRAFRVVAAAVHRRATRSAMLWAPNQAAGYPFEGGRYGAAPDGADAATLDTNRDGRLDARDDAYAPYYPGDDAVDWVGLSLYHWGQAPPWGENEAPDDGAFLGQLTGAGGHGGGVAGALPDFYRAYAEGHRKPLAIPETAAFYRPGADGASEAAIKVAWLQQAFSPRLTREHPAIKMVGWFEWRKVEPEVGAVVDWRVTARPELAAALRAQLAGGSWLGAGQPAAVLSREGGTTTTLLATVPMFAVLTLVGLVPTVVLFRHRRRGPVRETR